MEDIELLNTALIWFANLTWGTPNTVNTKAYYLFKVVGSAEFLYSVTTDEVIKMYEYSLNNQ
jgi:hypothetical protein